MGKLYQILHKVQQYTLMTVKTVLPNYKPIIVRNFYLHKSKCIKLCDVGEKFSDKCNQQSIYYLTKIANSIQN